MRASFIVTYAGVGSLGAAAWLGTQAAIAWAVALGLIGATALLVGASMVGAISFARPSRHHVRKAGTLGVTALLVTSVAFSGALGPASAVDSAQAASIGDVTNCTSAYVQTGIYSLTGLGYDTARSYSAIDEKCDFGADAANATQLAVYETTHAQNYSSLHYRETFNNMQQDTTSAAWSKAQIVIVNSLNDGKNASQAKAAAKEAVDDYYASQQKAVLHEWEGKVLTYRNHIDETWLKYQNKDGSYISSFNGETWIEYELANGEVVRLTSLSVEGLGMLTPAQTTVPALSVNDTSSGNGTLSNMGGQIRVGDPNSSDVSTVYIMGPYQNSLEDVGAQRNQVHNNIDTYVDGVYQDYQQGDINASDLANASGQAIATQAATDYNSTGHYGLANAAMAGLGAAGDTNASHTVNTTRETQSIEDGNVTTTTEKVQVSGTLFYTGDDNQSFVTGETYDPANLTGEVYMTVSSMSNRSTGEMLNSSGWFHVKEPFTVSEATNVVTGESINETVMEQREYNQTDPSQLEDDLNQTRETRNYWERQMSIATGGEGSGRTSLILIAAALVVGALAMSKRD